MRYEYAQKEKLLFFGPYPEVSLAAARDQRDTAKRLLREGRDPGLERKLQRTRMQEAVGEQAHEAVAREWYARTVSTWTGRHASDVLTSLERDVFPQLGQLPITEINPPAVLGVLRAIEARPAIETARRVRQRMSRHLRQRYRQWHLPDGPSGNRAGCDGALRQGPSAGDRGPGRST